MSSEHNDPCAACGLSGSALILGGHATRDIDRRRFLTAAALASIGAMLSACSGRDIATPLEGQTSLFVLDYPALGTIGGVALVTLKGAQLAIVRSDAVSYLALSRQCPHQGVIVNTAPGGFVCPAHGAEFNISGQWVGGQPTTSLISYPTAFEQSTGVLFIN
jgi:nitrite reductase/ring-hydroxylating ferredoxin subunit